MRTLRVLSVVGLSPALAGGARASCTDLACADQDPVDALCTEIAETCDCAAATSHKRYMKCVRGAIKDTVADACTTDDDCPEGRTCEDSDCAAPGGSAATRRCAGVYDEDEPIPLVFGELADDDMSNMFGYCVRQQDVPLLP